MYAAVVDVKCREGPLQWRTGGPGVEGLEAEGEGGVQREVTLLTVTSVVFVLFDVASVNKAEVWDLPEGCVV